MSTLRSKRSYAARHHASLYFNELQVEPLAGKKLGIRRAFLSDVLFAERIVEENTARFYPRCGLKWKASVFLNTFDDRETFILFVDGERAGVLQVQGREDALWIETLEVTRASVSKGLADAALTHAMALASRLGFGQVKVKTFYDSPTVDLYKKHGFSEVSNDFFKMIWLERSTHVL
jgi:GNAT superfamily N-acetyltransferase